jgi:hypothetical protein
MIEGNVDYFTLVVENMICMLLRYDANFFQSYDGRQDPQIFQNPFKRWIQKHRAQQNNYPSGNTNLLF